jgi:hypothetical protein
VLASTKTLEDQSYDKKIFGINFASFTREYVNKMDLPEKSMVYSVSCGVHAVAASDRFSTMRSIEGNFSENDALMIFLQ